MATPIARLLTSRWTWALAVIILLAWAAFVQVAAHLRLRGNLRRLDPGAPYRIEFGRGSGWHGLDTIEIRHDGAVTLHRLSREYISQTHNDFVETATLQLRPEALARVWEAVEGTGVLGLYRQYHEPDMADGTQWVLWVQQGELETSVYCDNNFPKPMVRFAKSLDGILAESGLEKAEWHRVPDAEARNHERELWDSIKW